MPKLTCECGAEHAFTDSDLRQMAGTPFTCSACGKTRKLPAGKQSAGKPGKTVKSTFKPVADPLADIRAVASADNSATPTNRPSPRRKSSSRPPVIPLAILIIVVLSVYGIVQFVMKNPAAGAKVEEVQNGVLAKALPGLGKGAIRKVATLGDATIRVNRVWIGHLKTEDRDGFVHEDLSDDKYLQLAITVENGSRTKVIPYYGWGSILDLAKLKLEDEFGNHYVASPLGLSAELNGGYIGGPIYPLKSVDDLLVFQRPVDAAQELYLTMPASAFGGKGDIGFRMPVPAN